MANRVGRDDYTAVGDGWIEWWDVGGALYGWTDKGRVLDADGCPLLESEEETEVRRIIERDRHA